jgi:hypothetical protein
LKRPPMPPDPCPYCGGVPEITRHDIPSASAARYPYRKDYGPVWVCPGCEARVGCHPRTEESLGRLADAELRAAKMAAHEAFDPLWKDGHVSRREAYLWLARRLGYGDDAEVHVGWMSAEECRRVVEVCTGDFRW